MFLSGGSIGMFIRQIRLVLVFRSLLNAVDNNVSALSQQQLVSDGHADSELAMRFQHFPSSNWYLMGMLIQSWQ
jgi:hypothetical protein